MYKLLFILLVLLSELSSLEIIYVNNKTEKVNISPKSDVFFDSQSIYNYENICIDMFDSNFIPIKSKSLSAGYTKDTIWTRFAIENNDHELFNGDIEIPTHWINRLDVYIQNDTGLIVKNLGTSLPFETREVSSSSFFIPIIIQPQERVTFYIRAQGTNAITLAPYLYSHEKSSQRLTYIAMFNAVLIGIIVIMVLYNLSIYLRLEDDNYLYYVIYLVGLLFFMGTYYGYNFQLFWQNSPTFNESITLPIIAFSFVTGLLFTRNFLDTKKNFPNMDLYLAIVMYNFIVLGLLSFIIDNTLITVYATTFLILFHYVGVIYVSTLSVMKKISGAKYFLLAWLISGLSMFLSSIMFYGYVDYDSLLYDSLAIGIILNILLLAFALVDRSRYQKEQSRLEVEHEHNAVGKISKSKDYLENLKEKLLRRIDVQNIQLREKENELKKLSIKDELTSLYNRAKLEELLANELHRAKRYSDNFSVILVNIDGLNTINEAHSHQVGDTVIQEMAGVLIKNIRYIDTVGRWSDTEYLIICPETNSEQASIASEHLQKAIQEYKFFFIGSVTVSFGVTSCLKNDSVKDIMHRAFEALSLAKSKGRDRVEAL